MNLACKDDVNFVHRRSCACHLLDHTNSQVHRLTRKSMVQAAKAERFVQMGDRSETSDNKSSVDTLHVCTAAAHRSLVHTSITTLSSYRLLA